MRLLGWFQVDLFFFIFFYSFFVGFFLVLVWRFWVGGRRLGVLFLAVDLLFLVWRLVFWFWVAMCWPYYLPYLWVVFGLFFGVFCSCIIFYRECIHMLFRRLFGVSRAG